MARSAIRFIRLLTPVFCTSDLSIRELVGIYRYIDVPWWLVLMPRGITNRIVRRQMNEKGATMTDSWRRNNSF